MFNGVPVAQSVDLCSVLWTIVVLPVFNGVPVAQSVDVCVVFSGLHVAQSLDFCVMVGRLLVGFVWLNL